jgi:hypothetical protein
MVRCHEEVDLVGVWNQKRPAVHAGQALFWKLEGKSRIHEMIEDIADSRPRKGTSETIPRSVVFSSMIRRERAFTFPLD